MKILAPLSLLSYLCLALLSSAGQVIWGSARFADNFTSAGPPNRIDSSFTFELGGFKNGFIPSSTNTNEWHLHWVAAQTSAYSDEGHFFTGSFVTPENQEPFRPSDQGYFWGYNQRSSVNAESTGEWILITSPTWHWPSGGTVSPPIQWSVSNATDAVIGAINDPNDLFHFQAASVTLPQSSVPSPSVWWTQHFPDQAESDEGWKADSDGDGLANLLEFALGKLPDQLDTDSYSAGEKIHIEGEVYWQIEIDHIEQSNVLLGCEVSSDLVQWSTEPSEIEPITTSPTQLIARSPYSANPRFFRLTARFAE